MPVAALGSVLKMLTNRLQLSPIARTRNTGEITSSCISDPYGLDLSPGKITDVRGPAG